MIRSRIAPTPSGYLHIGNALNFVRTWLMVRRVGGILRLRIDDIDATRVRPEYLDDIFRTLEWMGMDWDEGPQTVDEQSGIYSQALRAERYNEIIGHFIDTGRVFACRCSRRDMVAHHNVCLCQSEMLPLDTPDTALRIETRDEPIILHDAEMGQQKIFLDQGMKDFVIKRRDGISAYQVASLADDIDHDINLIVRGEDLLMSATAQLYLASLIGADSFSQTTFYHHSLIQDAAGNKLSKSAGSYSLKAMRERDTTSDKLYLELSALMGLRQPCTSLREMLAIQQL